MLRGPALSGMCSRASVWGRYRGRFRKLPGDLWSYFPASDPDFPRGTPHVGAPVVCEMWSRTTSQAQIRSWMLGQPLAPEAEYRYVGEGDPGNDILIDRRLSAPRHSQKTRVTPPPQHASFERQASEGEGSARAAQVQPTAGTAKARMSGEGQACAGLSGPAGGKTPRTARPSHSDHPPHSALT